MDVAQVPGYQLRQLFEATKRITSEIVPKETIRVIIAESLKVLNCDRISLFIYDKRIEMLLGFQHVSAFLLRGQLMLVKSRCYCHLSNHFEHGAGTCWHFSSQLWLVFYLYSSKLRLCGFLCGLMLQPLRLVLNASNLEHPIRVRPGQGIAGKVFTSK